MKIRFRMNLLQPATVYCSDNLKHAQSYAITWNTESYPQLSPRDGDIRENICTTLHPKLFF